MSPAPKRQLFFRLTFGLTLALVVVNVLLYWPRDSAVVLATMPSDWRTVSAGSLSAHINSQIDGLISKAGSYSSAKLNLYAISDDTKGVYVRNPSVWTGPVDLTGIATWSSAATGTGGPAGFLGTLITPTDVLVANHAAPAAGTIYRFTDNANVTYTATVSRCLKIKDDLAAAHIHWNGAAPSTLKIMPVFPATYQDFSQDHQLKFFPVICTNQYRQILVRDSRQAAKGNTSSFLDGSFYHQLASERNRVPWTRELIKGDSSCPVMTIINGEAVLLCCTTFVSSGISAADNIAGINQSLTKLDSDGKAYTVTTVNLDSPITFPTY